MSITNKGNYNCKCRWMDACMHVYINRCIDNMYIVDRQTDRQIDRRTDKRYMYIHVHVHKQIDRYM